WPRPRRAADATRTSRCNASGGLPRGVAAVGEDGLTGHPVIFVGQEDLQWCDVLDLRQPVAHGLRLVERDPLRGLLAVEERRVHRAGWRGVFCNNWCTKLFRRR